jgi:hypothetical protein
MNSQLDPLVPWHVSSYTPGGPLDPLATAPAVSTTAHISTNSPTYQGSSTLTGFSNSHGTLLYTGSDGAPALPPVNATMAQVQHESPTQHLVEQAPRLPRRKRKTFVISEQQRNEKRRLVKGVPQSFTPEVLQFRTDAQVPSSCLRTEQQKKNKREVGLPGSSCHHCKMDRKRVSIPNSWL